MDEARPREHLVAEMRRNGSLSDERVARAFERVARHRFVPEVSLAQAYEDHAISIKGGRGDETLASISQPSMLARMIELAEVEPGNRILEIGSGSGYNAALLAELAGDDGFVVTVDVEGTAGMRGIVVAGRERLHGGESAHTERCDRCLGAAGDHHIRIAALDGAEGIADGVR